jgi:hypothetical protein
MKYLKMRLNCMMRGHDWRHTSGAGGSYERCWRCYSERSAAAPEPSLTVR